MEAGSSIGMGWEVMGAFLSLCSLHDLVEDLLILRQTGTVYEGAVDEQFCHEGFVYP